MAPRPLSPVGQAMVMDELRPRKMPGVRGVAKARLRICVLTFLSVCLLGPSFSVGAKAESSGPSLSGAINEFANNEPALPAGFRVISTTSTSLVVDIQGPSYRLESSVDQDRPCQILNADGYHPTSLPGEPGMISAGVMLGIPLASAPSFTILSIDTFDLTGQVHLCPVATPVINHDGIAWPDYQVEKLIEKDAIYSQNSFFPAQPLELVPGGMIRSQHVARLIFNPFLYNPALNQLRSIRHVRVEVQFAKDEYDETISTVVDEGLFEPILRNLLINYAQAQAWRATSQPQSWPSSRRPASNQPEYKIQVNQDGLYQVSYSALLSTGVPVANLDPRTFQLFNQGMEVPIFVFGEQDGIFDPGDYLLFYGQRINTKYTSTNVYGLTWGGGAGLRMATLDGTIHDALPPLPFRTTLHIQEDHLYVNASPSGPQNDHWFWYLLNASTNNPVSHNFQFVLHNLDASSPTAELSGLLKGLFGEPFHHTRILINGYLVDDQIWPSTSDYPFSVEIPQSHLIEGNNTITVECPVDSGITTDMVLVNWFEVEYNHTYTSENNSLIFDVAQPGLWQFQVGGYTTDTIDVLDITNPLTPARIVGGSIIPDGLFYQVAFEQQAGVANRYLALSPSSWLTPVSVTEDAPSNLMDPNNGADYIVISHEQFLDAIQPLADYRASQGLRVKVVDVQDVYDEFSGGVFDPQAIKNFLSYAYSNWSPPAPAFVLLVGDGHYDYKNNYGDSGPIYIPPFLGEFDPWIGETASDNRFVTISGDDILPDMFIGRLPVNNADEASATVSKILSYEQDPYTGNWNHQLTFVADDADAAGNFAELSDNIADHYLPPEYVREKIYYGLAPYQDPADARDAILASINQGKLIVSYVGHGSIQFWAAENLFSVNSITSLTNSGKYPFFAPMTCAEGYFIFPPAQGYNYPSLAESLVRASDKGAIASFSPAGFGLADGHDILAHGLYKAFFTDGTTQFGPATTYAKYYLDANSTGFEDLIDTYILFGDPASRLNLPPTNLAFWTKLPLIIR
jgi:hypothetical protein